MDHLITALQRAKGTANQATATSPAGTAHTAGPFNYTTTRVVATDPAHLQRKRVINAATANQVFDSYRLLRTNILQRMREKNWTTLGVTSPTLNCGKTLTAINLAISIAMEVNQTVLLVDLDLRHPSIHRYFGIQPDVGLSDYIQSQANINDILFNPSIERMVVLPGKNPILNSSETLSSPRMVQLFTELKNRYRDRFIIFDLPPLLLSDDTLAFSPYTDAFLLVVEDNKTQINDIARAREMLKGANIVGSVLNKSGSSK